MALLHKSWFGEDDAAREDIDLILKFFVYLNVFDDFLDESPKIRIFLGRKGIGKSTLVKWASQYITDEYDKNVVFTLRGSDIYRSKKLRTTDNEYNSYDEVNEIIDAISSNINSEIAKSIDFALSSDDVARVHHATTQGKIRRDPASFFLDSIQEIFKDRLQINSLRSKIIDDFEMFKRGERKVWVLVDDLEYDYRDNEDYNSFLRSFFTACNQLCATNRHVRFRVVLRPDVWANIEAHADVGSKLRGQIFHIEWQRSDFKEFLFRRLPESERYEGNVSSNVQDTILSPYFPNDIEWAGRQTNIYDIIYSYSDRRPRWALDLLRESLQSAIYLSKDTLDNSSLKSALPRYSNSRLTDLSSEFSHECSIITQIARTFQDKPWHMSGTQLIEHIEKNILPLNPIINESQPNQYDVANFLVRIGFILQRVALTDSYMHFEYDDRIRPVNSDSIKSETNIWEINLCFREALETKQLAISLHDRDQLRSRRKQNGIRRKRRK